MSKARQIKLLKNVLRGITNIVYRNVVPLA